jgi:hypothetical protein
MPTKARKAPQPPKLAKKAKKADRLPQDVAKIRSAISSFFDKKDDQDRKIGNSRRGVYAFYDYDNEPIYVGQTAESLRQRISRHLTNQRTDAVAMNVLDPFEVADIEVWPLDDAVGGMTPAEKQDYLNRAEYTVFQKVLEESALGAVLNEGEIPAKEKIDLPPSIKQRIIPEEIYAHRKHRDIRIARRASTIANLARVISERDVSAGLRRTLLTQARRLEKLARDRMVELDIPES